jgi:hypothetical protein
VLWGDAILFGAIALLLLIGSIEAGYWQGMRFAPSWLEGLIANPILGSIVLLLVLIVIAGIHYGVRSLARKSLIRTLTKEAEAIGLRGDLVGAFLRSTRPWRSLFAKLPAGWGRGTRRRLHKIVQDTDTYVQTLNDRFTNPSGDDPRAIDPFPHPEAQSRTESGVAEGNGLT